MNPFAILSSQASYVIFASVFAALAVYLVWTRFFSRDTEERDLFEDAMNSFVTDAEAQARAAERQKSASARVKATAARIGARIPISEENSTKLRLRLARSGVDMNPATFYGMIALTSALGAGIALIIAIMLNAAPLLRIAVFLLVLSSAILLPFLYLNSARRRRVDELDRKLPDDIDLLVVTTRAGRSLTTGLQAVATYCDDAFAHELATASKEIAAGVSRTDALKGVRDRCDTPACDAFLSALIQASARGGESAEFLAKQSALCREQFRLKVEERVNKVGTKITLVLCLVIFPTMLIITLAPTAMQLFDALTGSVMTSM